jgi:hypothetical protein
MQQFTNSQLNVQYRMLGIKMNNKLRDTESDHQFVTVHYVSYHIIQT